MYKKSRRSKILKYNGDILCNSEMKGADANSKWNQLYTVDENINIILK